MSDDPRLQSAQFLAELAKQAGRQGDAVERMGRAAESIARDIASLTATRLTAALVRPWANDPRVVRVVLIQTQDDERRLREAVQRYETGDQALPMEDWLKGEGFRVVETRDIAPERRGMATFKAAAGTHKELSDASLEHLELEHKPD
jgi:glycine/D-amino acid oxidase-like deaminating enzyme